MSLLCAISANEICRHSSIRNFITWQDRRWPSEAFAGFGSQSHIRQASWTPALRVSGGPYAGQVQHPSCQTRVAFKDFIGVAPGACIAATRCTGIRVPMKTGSPPITPIFRSMSAAASSSSLTRSRLPSRLCNVHNDQIIGPDFISGGIGFNGVEKFLTPVS